MVRGRGSEAAVHAGSLAVHHRGGELGERGRSPEARQDPEQHG